MPEESRIDTPNSRRVSTFPHCTATENEKSTLKAAIIRRTLVAARTVTAYGGIVTYRSGGIQKSAIDAFKTEMRNRQDEFRKSHEQLGKFFSDNYLLFSSGGNNNFLALLDHIITFVTKTISPA